MNTNAHLHCILICKFSYLVPCKCILRVVKLWGQLQIQLPPEIFNFFNKY